MMSRIILLFFVVVGLSSCSEPPWLEAKVKGTEILISAPKESRMMIDNDELGAGVGYTKLLLAWSDYTVTLEVLDYSNSSRSQVIKLEKQDIQNFHVTCPFGNAQNIEGILISGKSGLRTECNDEGKVYIFIKVVYGENFLTFWINDKSENGTFPLGKFLSGVKLPRV